MTLNTLWILKIRALSVCLLTFFWFCVSAQDSVKTHAVNEVSRPHPNKINVLFYFRVISDAKGTVRIDENVVGNFRLNSWLRLEAGLRKGERPQSFDSYYHYKLELQSKYFWNSARLIARLSENVIQVPTPYYSKSNYLVITETKWPLSHRFSLMAAGGYVFTFQQNNVLDAVPSTAGVQNFYGTYKFGIRYALQDKGFVEATYGAYDVFNPYVLQSPFVQITSDYDVSRKATLYGYLRYQYDHSFDQPLNNFLGLGVRVRFK